MALLGYSDLQVSLQDFGIFIDNPDTNAFYLDNGKVGIGNTQPTRELDIIKSDTSTSAPMIQIKNTATGDVSIAFISDTNDFIMGIDRSDGNKFKFANDCDNLTANTRMTFDGQKLGIGTGSPLAKFHITQSSVTGNVPCLIMEQLDVDKHCIEFTGTEGANTTSTISTLTTSGSVVKHIKCEINGVVYWIAATANPS